MTDNTKVQAEPSVPSAIPEIWNELPKRSASDNVKQADLVNMSGNETVRPGERENPILELRDLSVPKSIDEKESANGKATLNVEAHDIPRSRSVKRRDSTGAIAVEEIQLFDTVEPVPNTYFYREGAEAKRPTLLTLRFGHKTLRIPRLTRQPSQASTARSTQAPPTRFGTWDGVFARCMLNIFGVILFMRLPWVVGQSGIGFALLIVLVSASVTLITSLSMSAICTNGVVRGGGAYYLISRSLGPEFGGAIGMLFSVANAIAVSMYILGFCELLMGLFPFDLTVGRWYDIQLYSMITCVLLFGLVLTGIGWVVKVQMLLLFLLLVAIMNYIIGTFARSPDPSIGFTGYSNDNAGANWGPQFTQGLSFFAVLAVFFPAVTGIMAGANISGDLKDAQEAIPKGTVSSVGFSTIIYLLLAVIAGVTITRNFMISDYAVMQKHSGWAPLFIVGVIAASISSAIASFVGAPRVFQAVCKDGLFPGAVFRFLAKGYGPENEPRGAYVLTFIIAMTFFQLGSLNSVATLITNFFLLSYALINYACFSASMSQAPGWRPSFRFYSPWISLIGSMACISIMFLIDWVASVISIVCGFILYKYVSFKKPDVNWGSALQANMYNNALRSTLKLRMVKDHIKTYRPQFLVMSGAPQSRPNLVYLATQLNSGKGLTVCGNVIDGTLESSIIEYKEASINTWLVDEGIKAFKTIVVAKNIRDGVRSLLESTGLGKLRPNTLLLGYKEDWQSAADNAVGNYVSMINDAFDLGFGIVVARSVSRLGDLRLAKHIGTIDIWWLSDDGGLSLLLPYLLQDSPLWRGCKLKVMTKGTSELTADAVKMARLLTRFRINADIVPMPGTDAEPPQSVIDEYLKMGIPIDDNNSNALRYIQIGNLIRQHSHNAALVVVTMPVKRETKKMRSDFVNGSVEIDANKVFMSWLEVLSCDLPPMLFIRGNQEDVLTFYS